MAGTSYRRTTIHVPKPEQKGPLLQEERIFPSYRDALLSCLVQVPGPKMAGESEGLKLAAGMAPNMQRSGHTTVDGCGIMPARSKPRNRHNSTSPYHLAIQPVRTPDEEEPQTQPTFDGQYQTQTAIVGSFCLAFNVQGSRELIGHAIPLSVPSYPHKLSGVVFLLKQHIRFGTRAFGATIHTCSTFVQTTEVRRFPIKN
jgi:hypothetical protein